MKSAKKETNNIPTFCTLKHFYLMLCCRQKIIKDLEKATLFFLFSEFKRKFDLQYLRKSNKLEAIQ